MLNRFIALLLIFIGPVSNLYSQHTTHIADSLQQILLKEKTDTQKVILLIELANEVSYYDSKKALEYVHQGIALSKKLNYQYGICRLNYIGGFIYTDLNDFTTANQMLNEAQELATALKRIDILARINNARGNMHFIQSDMYNASLYYTKALELFEQVQDTVKEVVAYQNLIASLGEVKNYERAIKLSLEVLEKLRLRKDSLQMAYAYNHLLVGYLGLEQTEAAAPYVPLLNEYIKRTKDIGLASDSYNVIGDYYSHLQRYDSAIIFYNKALQTSLRENFQPSYFKLSLGTAYLRKQNLPKAFEYLTDAMRLSKQSNTMDVYYKACLPMSEYYSKINDPAKAYAYLLEYNKLNDSVISADTREYASYLEATYESHLKEKNIADLKIANAEKELAVVKKNRLLMTGGSIALASLIIIGLLYRTSRQKNMIDEKDKRMQAEQILFLERQQQLVSLQSMVNGQETERTRIAKDLHDGLGGLFSTIKMHLSTLQHERPDLKSVELFNSSYGMINSASEEVRRIAHNMMPEVLIKLGLVQAVQEMSTNISAGKLLKVSVQAYGMDHRMNASTEIMLFRIIQELLNNTIKHARATEAIIQFNKDGNRLSITVEDNGRGFNISETDSKSGAGLPSVQSRVHYLNGQFSIDSQKDVGTTVLMDFLINE